MADSSIAVTAGAGTQVDTRTQAGGDHRQVIVQGDADSAATQVVDAAGAQVQPGKAAAAAIAAVAASASSVTLAASNSARKGLTIVNDSTTATLYVKLGSGAVIASSWTEKVLPGDAFYHPADNGVIYTGLVAGIWSAASGQAMVTELT
jgi:predicted ribonuclease toxin of YeeF-YezG toxin-antitoxin module